jgi:Protein of unknown function (DUF1838)
MTDPRVAPAPLDRRRLLAMAAATGVAATGAAAGADSESTLRRPSAGAAKPSRVPADFPRDDPAFNVLAVGRLQGDLSGATTYVYNPGVVYGVVPGQGLPPAEFGLRLFKVEGCTRRISRRLADGSVEERSRNWMFYCDAESGAPLERLQNPWTRQWLDVPPWRGSPGRSRLTVNGPQVAFGPGFENSSLGQPLRLDWRTLGDTTWVGRQSATRLRDPNGRFRNEMSIDAWVCRTRDVADARLTHIPSTYAWTSFAEWMPWLGMGSRPGNLLWRIESTVLHSADALPATFRERMQRVLPGKLEEPLGWDG